MRRFKRSLSFAGLLLLTAVLCLFAVSLTRESANTLPASVEALPAVSGRQRTLLVPGGQSFGVKIYASGVMVVGTSEIETPDGVLNPAAEGGVRIKDIITAVGGEKINTVEQLAAALQACGGDPVTLTVMRKDRELTLTVCPVQSVAGGFQVGLWVRDSTAGIGTLTFYDPASGWFGGLGHAICDVDTGEIVPIDSGTVVGATVLDVRRGVKGAAGELVGVFEEGRLLGHLKVNCGAGVFGPAEPAAMPQGEAIPMAYRDEIREGPAEILCSASGKVERYSILITRVMTAAGDSGKSMTLEVTDPRLLELTGGIVQGMSGSPILQDGRLVGAVTHVLVNDPTRGYGIFIENMLRVVN
ncbi:MAG: SpoIVB peptidase [Clostridia bacterium]|nr:SpoIVB peptidase [Clostridia bacterium]